MPLSEERVQQDIVKIQDLARNSNGRIKIVSLVGNPTSSIFLELGYPTVPNSSYPLETHSLSKIKIELLARYPKDAPIVTISTPIFHPNVFESGRVCLGHWIITEFLDLLVQRIVRILIYDPSVIDVNSAANASASTWYLGKMKVSPKIFPTMSLDNLFLAPKKTGITWKPLT